MPHYFFDTHDGATAFQDEIGLDLDGIESARDEATRALADLARDTIPGAIRKELVIDVCDEARRPLLRASLWFEVAAVT